MNPVSTGASLEALDLSGRLFGREGVLEDWSPVLGRIFESQALQNLARFLNEEHDRGAQVFPPREHYLRALKLTSYQAVRAVVVGQDPYHDDGQANGLAFAVNNGMRVPPSLRNIFKEISSDLGLNLTPSSSLLGWAQQGVLLLNTVLSVRAHEPFSHRGQGWETLTDELLRRLNEHPLPLVFLLWGAPAQEKGRLLTDPRHLILRAAHPSPLSAYRGFLGCRHFSQANAFLARRGREPIDWSRIDAY